MTPIYGKSIWVVIPVFNEAPVLESVLKELVEFPYEFVLVDDGSIDGSFPISSLFSEIHCIRHSRNYGQGAAIQTGISYALEKGAQAIVTFDADGQHDPRDIAPGVTFLLENKLDLVLGSRFLRANNSIPSLRRLFLKLAILFTKYRTPGLLLTDTHNGFRVFSRNAATRLTITQSRMAHATEILDWIANNGLRYGEVPNRVYYTKYSCTKGESAIQRAISVVLELFKGGNRGTSTQTRLAHHHSHI